MTGKIIFLIIGTLGGFIFGWLITKFLYTTKSIAKSEFDKLQAENQNLRTDLKIENERLNNLTATNKKNEELISNKTEEIKNLNNQIFELSADNRILTEKLNTQKNEIEEIKSKFNIEFKNIANQILEEKSVKFTELNKINLESLLKPLGENINNFKKKVEETYDKESKQRFSLEEKIKDLILLNNKISEDANNLTNALKGQAKTMGDWGEMILENILENSGLVKDREYFVQEFLKDENGNFIKSEDGAKLQPDVIISYPDNRKVIIDSKVSLVAYEKFCACDNVEEQEFALSEHIKSIKKHIDGLSAKNYDQYEKSLDFVMMFIPIEPAYMIALQKEPDLWNYAYTKRILLISPTNLIAVLKIIVDLWKREYQNKNAIEIANRGELLYDKFASFIESLEDIGKHIENANTSFNKAMGQLKDGRGNLISQAQKLKELGLKPKKTILLNQSPELTENDFDDDTDKN